MGGTTEDGIFSHNRIGVRLERVMTRTLNPAVANAEPLSIVHTCDILADTLLGGML